MEDKEKQSEFVQLLSANTKRMYAFIRILVLNNEADAEEVFQNTCLAVWNKFSLYDPTKDFGAWACRMAHFESLKLRDNRKNLRFLSDDALASLADAAQPIARRVDERREALANCVSKLNSRDYAMIERRYFEGVLPKAIAISSSRSVDAIYRELSRIHKMLSRCVEGHLAEGVAE